MKSDYLRSFPDPIYGKESKETVYVKCALHTVSGISNVKCALHTSPVISKRKAGFTYLFRYLKT